MAKETFDIVKLSFSSPVHLARGKSDYATSHEILHSDSLKSAIFASAMLAGIDVAKGQFSSENVCKNDFLDSFQVSSAFPFFEDEYFFPKPKCEIHEVWECGEKDRKGKKDIAFVGQAFFEEIISGKPFSRKIEKELHVNKIENLGKPRFSKFAADKMLAWREANADFFIVSEDHVLMRVAIPRHFENENQQPRPYYVEQMFFPEKGGLYFFIKIDNEKYRKTIETALEMLGESGIGTDRNVGNGQFCHKFSNLELNLPDDATHQILLSLCCPTENEAKTIAQTKNVAYNLVKRGGYISSPAENDNHMAYRKKSVFMLDEGSIVPKIEGVLHDLKPNLEGFSLDEKIEHPIWRDGRAFSLPIKPIFSNDNTQH